MEIKAEEDPEGEIVAAEFSFDPENPSVPSSLLTYINEFEYPVNDVDDSYERLLKIGQGTFGEVFKARCKKSGDLVALKKVLMENEKEGFPITALREIKMLQMVRHENVTELIEICSERNSRGHVFYLVFLFCAHDLAALLASPQVKFKLADIKTMMKHILEALFNIHGSNILHRDMKTSNILITHDGILKLADFGLARLAAKQAQNANCFTNRVVTLWYRPPELLLGTRDYNHAIDIWGAGCIMAELFARGPILQGATEQNQLMLISQLCGSINEESWPNCEKLPLYSKMELPQKLPRKVTERMMRYTQSSGALSLLDSMLALNPKTRPTAEEALDSNFFYEQPRPQPNISGVIKDLRTNLFEFTSKCGAHANNPEAR